MIQFSPAREVAVQFGSFSIRWYALMYVVGFWLVRVALPLLGKYRSVVLPNFEWTRIVAWGALGALLGGRVGYALLYEPAYYAQNLGSVFSLSEGGMSFHGGLIGALICLWFIWNRIPSAKKYSFLTFLDVLAPAIAASLALGRVGNFINQELFAENFALYAAAAHAVIAILCAYVLMRTRVHVGRVAGLFALLYGLQRIVLEVTRVDGWSGAFGASRGQLLTAPVLFIGLWLLIRNNKIKSDFGSFTSS